MAKRGGRANMRAIAELKSRGSVQNCYTCGRELYADLPKGDPDAITLGHFLALEDFGPGDDHLLWDPDNYGPQCGHCNYGDGARRSNRNQAYKKARAQGITPTRTVYINPRWQ